MMESGQQFETLEIYLAAYMSLNGFKPETFLAKDSGKVFFVFDKDAEGFYKLLNTYYDKATTISLSDYIREVKYLRGKMNQARRQEDGK